MVGKMCILPREIQCERLRMHNLTGGISSLHWKSAEVIVGRHHYRRTEGK